MFTIRFKTFMSEKRKEMVVWETICGYNKSSKSILDPHINDGW